MNPKSKNSLGMALAGLCCLALLLGASATALAECCQGYCACVDWQTGGEYAGCTITYDKDDEITNVTCGYSSGGLVAPEEEGQT